MEEDAKFMTTPFLEVRDPQLNISEIVNEIEAKIPKNPSAKVELSELTKISYRPESPEGFRKFDPAGTAHLFEKGITTPKFTNPKFWFIKGPIKFIISRIISVYSLVDKKLSENRIRAFFSVLHELVRLSKRMSQLEKRFDGFYRDHLLVSQPNNFNEGFGWSTSEYFVDSGIDEDWSEAIADLQNSKFVSVLFPDWGEFLKQLSFKKIPFISYTSNANQWDLIHKKITSEIKKIESIFPIKYYLKPNSDVVIYVPLNRFPTIFLEKLFSELSDSIQTGSHLYFCIQEYEVSHNHPFVDIQVSKVDTKILPDYLRRLGFEKERNLSSTHSKVILKYTKVK